MQATHFVVALLLAAAAPRTSQGLAQQQVSVQTSSGLLVGQRGQQVHRFLGVPYARAPLGPLRFRQPEELPEQRQQLVDATRHAKTCPQYRHLARFVSPLLNLDAEHQISEDCLHLSLYVPSSVAANNAEANNQQQLEPSRQLPVLVWLPGEGFDFADARQFDGSHLAHRSQALVVVVQYRVGALGFLHAPQLNITGNMGLHDQLAALRWLRRNLQAFGGDPDRVTLMGRFSGSMSISALITAPEWRRLLRHQGQPLFQRAALLSGVAVPHWIIDERPQERLAHLLAEARRRGLCLRDNATCLADMPLEQLMRVAGYGWRPVRDDAIIGERAPIEAAGANQLAEHLEAVLLGETAQEGTLCLYRHLLEDPATDYARQLQENQLSQGQLEQMMAYDAQTYFGLAKPAQLGLPAPRAPLALNDTRQAYLDACAHYMVKGHADRFKRQLLARNRLPENRLSGARRPLELYHYELRYKPSFSLAPDYIKTAAHGDDVPLLFGLIYNQPRLHHDQRDLLMTRKLMSYVANFVHGNGPLLARWAPEADVVSMEEQEGSLEAARPASFAGEAALDVLELGEAELSALEMNKTAVGARSFAGRAPPAVRLILLDSQQQQTLFEQPEPEEPVLEAGPKARRLVELHRQQVLENNNLVWYQMSRRPALQPLALPAASPGAAVNESSFITLFVFSSCTILFVLMSVCLGLCLLIVRHNTGRRAKLASVSSCNICDDSRQSIEAALQAAQSQAPRKEGREFGGSVFAKFQQRQAGAHSSAAGRAPDRQPDLRRD